MYVLHAQTRVRVFPNGPALLTSTERGRRFLGVDFFQRAGIDARGITPDWRPDAAI